MHRYELLSICVLVVASGCATRDPGDLTFEARAVVATAEVTPGAITLGDALGLAPPPRLPAVVRVWRRGLDGSEASCEGRVDVLPLEDYVAGVLPSEWLAGWPDASLDAGAIAARTYASFWVAAGGRYSCADVDDTPWSQVYRDTRHPRSDAAVARTRGQVVLRDGDLVFAEYSAEHGGLTATGALEPHCRDRPARGHGRGMCQWGTERWAREGRDAAWMVAHYYDGAGVGWL